MKSVKCYCGRRVALDGFDTECACGQRFNGVGQELRTYCCSLDEQGIDCGHGEVA